MRIQQKSQIKTQGFYSESEPEYLAIKEFNLKTATIVSDANNSAKIYNKNCKMELNMVI